MKALADGFVGMTDSERLEYLYAREQAPDKGGNKGEQVLDEAHVGESSSRRGVKRAAPSWRRAGIRGGGPPNHTLGDTSPGAGNPGTKVTHTVFVTD